MNELEQLELILRRMHAKRQRDFEMNGATLNVDSQELLRDIAEEIARSRLIERR